MSRPTLRSLLTLTVATRAITADMLLIKSAIMTLG